MEVEVRENLVKRKSEVVDVKKRKAKVLINPERKVEKRGRWRSEGKKKGRKQRTEREKESGYTAKRG